MGKEGGGEGGGRGEGGGEGRRRGGTCIMTQKTQEKNTVPL